MPTWDAAVRQELARLDLTDRGFNQTTVVASLARCQGICEPWSISFARTDLTQELLSTSALDSRCVRQRRRDKSDCSENHQHQSTKVTRYGPRM
jgi:hypothetical protein